MSRVWLYLAESSDQQAAVLESDAIWAKETADAQGWEIERTFSDVATGKGGVRSHLTAMLVELEATPQSLRPEIVMMTRLDRVGRGSIVEGQFAVHTIHKLGPRIFTRARGFVGRDTAMEELFTAVELAMARQENEVRADRVRSGILRRQRAGKHLGTVPFGCVLIDGVATAYEPEAAFVREIFERRAEGWGYSKLARMANARQPAKRLPDGSERRLAWSPSTIKSILRSRTLRDVVVPIELAEAVDRSGGMAFLERAPARHPWPLRGAVRCTCGKLLSGHLGGNGPRFYRYYFCRWHQTENGPIHPAHPAEELEAGFVDLLRGLTADAGVVFEPEQGQSDDAARQRERDAKARLDELEKRRQKAWAMADELTPAQLRERLDEIDGDRKGARAQLEAARQAIDAAKRVAQSIESLVSLYAELIDLWPNAPVEQQQDIAQAVAALPTVCGLWAHPERRGRLLSGLYVANEHLIEDKIRGAPYEQRPIQSCVDRVKGAMLPGKHAKTSEPTQSNTR